MQKRVETGAAAALGSSRGTWVLGASQPSPVSVLVAGLLVGCIQELLHPGLGFLQVVRGRLLAV